MEITLNPSRRDFLKTSATALACATTLFESQMLYAKSLNLPLGLQLYSVRQLLPTNYAGTLKDIASLGFKEVESAGYYNHSAAEVKQAVSDAGLKLVSAHHSSVDLHKDLDHIISFSHDLGLSYIICSFPGKTPANEHNKDFHLDDWKWNADEFNKIGEKVAVAGMKFGYHNHTVEFTQTDGVLPFVELMRLTDPTKVTVEMDCGWVIVGGGNPVDLLKHYGNRISMLHVKDFILPAGFVRGGGKPATEQPKIEELGLGSVDYKPILEAAAATGHIKHCFVEQEGFNVPPLQSLKIDADYMHKLGAAS
jgi:sugar phosphate isomerase/epimerase